MKRLVLFVVALVFAFCTTVMAADKPAAVGTAAPAKAADTKKVKKEKKAKKDKKAEKKAEAPAAAPAVK
jgi:sugar phosphate permease